MAQNLGIGVILKSLFWIMKNQKYLLTKYKKVNSGRMLKTSELGKLNVISNQFQ